MIRLVSGFTSFQKPTSVLNIKEKFSYRQSVSYKNGTFRRLKPVKFFLESSHSLKKTFKKQ